MADINKTRSQVATILLNAESMCKSGGTAGQVLVKASGSDFDVKWVTPSSGSGGGGGGESDVFYAIYGTTTNAEILAAYEAGKAVYLKVEGSHGVYRLLLVNSTTAYFGGITSTRRFARYRCFSDTWTTYDQVVLAPMATSAAVTLTASGWSSSKTQTVTVSGVLADEAAQLITPTPAIASQTAYYGAGIRCTGQAANSLNFTAETIPSTNLTVYVTVQEVSAS